MCSNANCSTCMIYLTSQLCHLASDPNHPVHALVLQPPVLEASQAVLHKTEPRLIQERLVRVAGLPAGSVGIPATERRVQ